MAFQIAYVFEAIDRFSKVAEKIEKQVGDIEKKIGNSVKKFEKFEKSGEKALLAVHRQTPKVSDGMRQVERKTKEATLAMRFMSATIGNLKFRLASLIVTAGTTGLGLSKIIETGSKLESKLTNLSALTGIAGKDLAFLREEAFKLQKVFGVPSDEIFVALKRVAGLRPELIKDVHALRELTRQVLILDAPINELEKTSRTLTVALNIFGKGTDHAAKFTEILAASARLGSAEVNEVGLSFLKAGSVMQLSNITFKEGIALIQTLARSGLLKQAAGVGLNTVLLRLQRAGFDLKKMKIGDVFQEIGEKIEGMTDSTKRAEEIYRLFGLRQTKTGVPLFKNLKLYNSLVKELGKGNIAFETAQKELSTYEKKTEGINAVFDKFSDRVFKKMSPALLQLKLQFFNFLDALDLTIPGGIGGLMKAFLELGVGLLKLANIALYTIGVLTLPLELLDGWDAFIKKSDALSELWENIIKPFPTLEGEIKSGSLKTINTQNGKVNVDVNLKGNTDALSSVQTTSEGNVNVNSGINMAFAG